MATVDAPPRPRLRYQWTRAAEPPGKTYPSQDVAFNVTWKKSAIVGGGTLSLDIPVYGLRELSCYAISDEDWFLDMGVYDELDSGVLFWSQITTGARIGVNNGGTWEHVFVAIRECRAQRVRFSGRGFTVASPHSTIYVWGRE